MLMFNTRDHPRVGGGTHEGFSQLALRQGPSPRGRGNRPGSFCVQGDLGTIPAWAGEPEQGRSGVVKPLSF